MNEQKLPGGSVVMNGDTGEVIVTPYSPEELAFFETAKSLFPEGQLDPNYPTERQNDSMD